MVEVGLVRRHDTGSTSTAHSDLLGAYVVGMSVSTSSLRLSMVSALVFGEYLAAAIVALMYAGGQHLESFAERHASREMTALLARVPRSALRHRQWET